MGKTREGGSGDFIVAADGRPVESMDELTALVRKKNPGDGISITVYRGGGKESVNVTVEEEPKTVE